MICGVTVFHLSLLYLDSQSFKIVWKFYLPAPSYYSFSGSWLWRKQTLELLVILNIFSLCINNYCWPEHVIPWAGREGYCSDSYLSDLTFKQSICQPQYQIIQMMCPMFGDCHMFRNIIFDWITQIQLSYCFTGLALVGTCWPKYSSSSSLLAAYKLNEIRRLLLFKKIFLKSMFGCILIVSRGYILLISIFPMLKAFI